ncbi:MAG: hypothetical protein Q7K34_00945 [archaeon]|nr:hypothetical protein [archaeon]
MSYLVFAIALFFSAVNFFSEIMSQRIEKHHSRILSLSAGVFLAYIFLTLLPEALKSKELLGEAVFPLILAGFIFFHALEKYFYQHVKNKSELLNDLSWLHAAGFFLDHFLAGMILFFAANTDNIITGVIIAFPLLLHIISSSISLTHINEHFERQKSVLAALSLAPLAGTLFAAYIDSFPQAYHAFFAVSVGMLLYTVMRDVVPKEDGSTLVFLAGIIISILAVAAAKTLAGAGIAGLFF